MEIKERLKKIKEWSKEHKADIIRATVLTALGGGTCYLLMKGCRKSETNVYDDFFVSNEDGWSEFDMVTFVSGVRNQFLGIDGNTPVEDVTPMLKDALSEFALKDDAISMTVSGDRFLEIAQHVKPEDGEKVFAAMLNAVNCPDDLQIWISGIDHD